MGHEVWYGHLCTELARNKVVTEGAVLSFKCAVTDKMVVWFSEKCAVKMRIPARNRYKQVRAPKGVRIRKITGITFSVKACNDANLILHTSGKRRWRKGANMLQIVLGGWRNRKSVIRKGRRRRVVARRNHRRGLLHCNRARHFYITWARGHIRVGRTRSRRPLLSYNARYGGFYVKRLYIGSWRSIGRRRILTWRISK